MNSSIYHHSQLYPKSNSHSNGMKAPISSPSPSNSIPIQGHSTAGFTRELSVLPLGPSNSLETVQTKIEKKPKKEKEGDKEVATGRSREKEMESESEENKEKEKEKDWSKEEMTKGMDRREMESEREEN